ncbi:hypothetical protein CC78DRAFT_19279 [Lojkania enalia]|uniref:Uncharacterized protein n=1 Tax=Lojkania enalia TaxID=147567 RepID=A0A9P4N867_9PLEO|nr:hypothetical protein CC78DRAFT_19279 [Didymosphaeria enalia]
MGNCGSSLNCDQCYSSSGEGGCVMQVDVDPDIAGIGILVSFFLNALITFIAILWGYATDSLPETVLSKHDVDVIRWYQKTYLATKFFPGIRRLWLSVKTFVLRRIAGSTQQPLNDPPGSMSRHQRVEAITRFVLALSDQQLVTGIAAVVATLANRCTMSLFEFRIVTCLVWFSATTHLTTLGVLREYMYNHPVVRNLRVIGISAFLVLLAFIQAVNVAAGINPTEFPSNLNSVSTLQCVFTKKPRFVSVTQIWLRSLVLLYISFRYIQHMRSFFTNPATNDSFEDMLWTKILLRFPTSKAKKYRKIPDPQWRVILSKANASYEKRFQFPLAWYPRSFLANFPQFLYFLLGGISLTIATIWVTSVQVSKKNQDLGFGQVAALTILVLPALAAAEIYNESRVSSRYRSSQEDPGQQDQMNIRETQRYRDDTSLVLNRKNSTDLNALRFYAVLNKLPVGIVLGVDSTFLIVGGVLYPLLADIFSIFALQLLMLPLSYRVAAALYRVYKKLPILRRQIEEPQSTNPGNSSSTESLSGPKTPEEANQDSPALSRASTGVEAEPTRIGLNLRRQTTINESSEETFPPPVRQDTEADIALVPLSQQDTRRRH